METKFTKGEWRAVGNSREYTTVYSDEEEICTLKTKEIAVCDFQREEEQVEIKNANARLIAAAPELYKALEKSHDLLKDLAHTYMADGEADCTDVFQLLIDSKSVLNKARGEQEGGV